MNAKAFAEGASEGDVRRGVETFHEDGVDFRENEDLSEFTYFKTGGRVALLVFPTSIEQLSRCVETLNGNRIPFKVIGETSNLVFLDDRTYTCLVSTVRMNRILFNQETSRFECEAGAMLPDLSRRALLEGLGGFAGMEGIPGTVGGAVFMNASAYGDGIHKVLDSVDVVDPDGSVRNMKTAELGFAYRDSIFKRGESSSIVVRAHFHAAPGDRRKIYAKMELAHAKRHKYNEYMYPNLGSVFAGSIYRALAASNLEYRIVSTLFYLFNYRWKLFRRESPLNRRWINDYTVRKFGITFGTQPFSDKTMNTLVNAGIHTDDVVKYIEDIKKLTRGSVPVENEVVNPF